MSTKKSQIYYKKIQVYYIISKGSLPNGFLTLIDEKELKKRTEMINQTIEVYSMTYIGEL